MCCVLKAAAQRVILRGEHAKVALDLHLCLWDFGWMFGSLTVSWGGEGEWFLRVVPGVALNQFCASEGTCCWFCSVLVRVSSLCRTTEWLRMEGPSVGHQSKPLFQLAQVLSRVGAFSSCVLIICKADFYPAEMAHLLCPCQVLYRFLSLNLSFSVCNLSPLPPVLQCTSGYPALPSLDLPLILSLTQPGGVGPGCYKGTLLAPLQLAVHQDPRSFPAKPHPNQPW